MALPSKEFYLANVLTTFLHLQKVSWICSNEIRSNHIPLKKSFKTYKSHDKENYIGILMLLF